MKSIKTIIMVAGIIAAVASCNKNEIENREIEDLGDVIGFIVNTAAETKGTVVTTSSLNTDGSTFKCDVWMAEAPRDPKLQHLINECTVKYTSGVWKFVGLDEQPRWINGIETQFWAWSPESLTPTAPKANDPGLVFNYTLPEPDGVNDATNQKDVLVAYTAKTFDVSAPEANVAINFKHALPQINFTVQAASIGAIDITSVTLENVATSGEFTFSTAGKFSVTASTSKASYGQDSPFTGATEGTLNGQKAFTTTNNFFMIPQTLDGAKITVKKSNGEILSASLSNKPWEPGKYYNYKLSFSDHELVVTLVAWEDVDGGPVTTDILCMPLWSYCDGLQL